METLTKHTAASRGFADHGWLKARHTFSFANYHDPERVHFGVLRVLNDDIVQGGMGFGMHPHDNMEIITIPIKGKLQHKDSMGNTGVISENEIQVMSAGTGIMHSEINPDHNNEVNLLQIWVMPLKRNIKPRYDQKKFNPTERENKFQLVVCPELDQHEGALWINQNAYFSLGKLEKGAFLDYNFFRSDNGLYIFVIDGSIEADGELLEKRDGLGITVSETIKIEAKENAEILLMEIPMLL